MAKHIDSTHSKIKIDDLLSKDGITFEVGEQFHDDEDDEEFSYSPYVQYSNEEMLHMLNMNDFEDEDDGEEYKKKDVSLYGISFEQLRSKMTNITTDQKVMKFVKQKGIGEIVPCNAQVFIHYIGYFEDRDEPFDSTYVSGKPKTCRLGQGEILPGLELGISTMQKHEIAVFLIHPDLAYKTIGCPPRIPPNEEVAFVVHLVDFLDDGTADTYKNLSIEEKQSFQYVREAVRHMLVSAKDSFTKLNVKRAIREYNKAINCLETVKLRDSTEEEEMNEMLSRACTNLSVCYNKLDMPRNACRVCRLAPLPTAKTYYNFGKALLNLAEYDEAMKELQKAYKLEPHNSAIKKAIQLTNVKQRQYLEIEKRLWKNCFKSKEEQIKITEFRTAARDLCKSVIDSNDIMRQSLPEGFTEEEHQIIREEAAILGLNVVTCLRFGKETIYLQKSKT